MRRLSLIAGLLVILTSMRLIVSSPHGDDFKMNCDDCHTTDSWQVNPYSINFSHDTTRMPLTGQHREIGCRMCHESLVFKDADPSCVACHTDLHENTVGKDCERCHSTVNWIVTNIIDIHRTTRFPLLGAHAITDCQQCHQSASLLRFEPLGIECYDCHIADYASTTSPNHIQASYSKECTECHKTNGYSWSGAGINHDFFPLKEGHDIADCMSCHTDGNFGNTSRACISCHQTDYNATSNPPHQSSGFPQECEQCHTLIPGWRPASFSIHDQYFPIYSGEHNGEWSACSDCHSNQGSFNQFSCIDCHEHNQSDMNEEHEGVSGYSYNSLACYGCHPTGSAEGAFDHNTTGFALTGAHTGASCLDCHSDGYAGTTNTCSGCHLPDYNQTTNPPHSQINFPTECQECHNETAWEPTTFNHDGQYFPIYSGEHNGTWSSCAECHTNTSNYQQFSCIDCHEHNQTDMNEEHSGITGYNYNSPSCFACHPDGSATGAFNHNSTEFPLTGAHSIVECSDCHTSGYTGTSMLCFDCHAADYNQALNPGHVSANLPHTCSDCHSTQPGWSPASFAIHNQYYPLNGAHASISDCNLCHNGNFNTAPTTCSGCHLADYNSTSNPPHVSAQFPTICQECHSEIAWSPSTFNHDAQYFPIYSGEHNGQWNVCSDCHNNPSNYGQFTCIDCHEHNQTDMNEEHDDVSGYVYNSTSCFNCHPDGESKAISPVIRKRIK